MKITINTYGKAYSVESDEDVDAESLANMFKGLMVSMGFHPKNVDQLFNTELEWFPKEELKTNSDQKKVDKEMQDYLHNLYNQTH
jgi:Tat protein secretion system quality control protein TatD with DNase activity